MVTLHSLLRWLVLLSAVLALAGYGRAQARSRFDDLATRLGTVYTITLSVQFLVGVVLWLVERRWELDNVFLSIIHPVIMIVAISIASAGTARARRTSSAVPGLVAVALSLVLIVLAIPSWS
jgi:hypothetical protein